MAVLDEEQKRFVVRRNARRMKPARIKTEFKDEYGIEISAVQICDLDPTTAHGRRSMGEELKTYFQEERDAYTKDVEAAPLNCLAFRQNLRLDRMENDEIIAKSPKMWLAYMEQAAKDAGGQFLRAPASTRAGVPGEEGGNGEGGDDDNAESAERTRRVDEIRQLLRDRRAGDTAAARVDEPPPGFGDPPAGTH